MPSDENLKWRRVLEVAAANFEKKGYLGTSIQDIATEVGILKGSLYHYIRSKEDLLFAVLVEHHQSVFQNVERLQANEGLPYPEKLREFIRWHVWYNASNALRAPVFYRDYRYLSDERRAEIIDARHRYETEFVQLIHEGVDGGHIRSNLDPKTDARMVLGVMNSLHQWYRHDAEVTPEQLADRMTELILDGLFADAGTSDGVAAHRQSR